MVLKGFSVVVKIPLLESACIYNETYFYGLSSMCKQVNIFFRCIDVQVIDIAAAPTAAATLN